MGDLVNLRRIKKLRAQAAKKQEAAQNRVRFGRTASERVTERLKDEHDRTILDGKRLADSTED